MAPPSFDRLAYARGVLRAEAASLDVVAGRLDDAVRARSPSRCSAAAAGSPSSASASPPTSARRSSARSTRPAPGPTCSTPRGPSTATSAWSTRTTSALLLSHSGESEELVRLLGPLPPARGGRRWRSPAARGQHAGPGRGRRDRLRPDHGSVPARAGPEHQHDGHARPRRRPRVHAAANSGSSRAEISPGSTRPAASGRKLATVDGVHAPRRGTAHRPGRPTPCARCSPGCGTTAGGPGPSCSWTPAAGWPACSPTATWPGCSRTGTDAALDAPIAQVMTRSPVVIGPDARVAEAVEMLQARKISELPVVDAEAGRSACSTSPT